MPTKEALGMSMNISQEFVDNLAKELISQSLVETLGGSDRIVEEMIRQVLGKRVNPRDGTPSDYRDAIPMINYFINTAIKEELKETIKEFLNENRPKIRAALKKELAKQKTIDSYCAAFTDSLMTAVEYNWRTSIDVTFTKE